MTIGMLRQTPSADQDKTVEELLLEGCPQSDLFSRERFSYEMEYDRIFTGFGFVKEDEKRKLSSFSGGEQRFYIVNVGKSHSFFSNACRAGS